MFNRINAFLRKSSAKKSLVNAVNVAEGRRKRKRKRESIDELLENGRKWARINGK